ncbi:MAG: hypothetical protein NC299_11365 [Lachnospiraceae bacterium]|nr:hypothetical protein [Ruminococcus sp.]MCM1275944.1 hypothetical protein [Lachnospiraceae bacterium]
MTYPVNDNTNLAYDLSMFDTAERDRREKQRRADAEARKIRLAPLHSVSRSGSRIKIVMAMLMIFAALFAVNYYNTKRDDVARMVSEQEALLNAARDDNNLLQSRLDSKVNIGYIEKYATEQLGMSKVAASQKKYISVNEELIEVAGDDTEGLFGSFKRGFSAFLEYIGF